MGMVEKMFVSLVIVFFIAIGLSFVICFISGFKDLKSPLKLGCLWGLLAVVIWVITFIPIVGFKNSNGEAEVTKSLEGEHDEVLIADFSFDKDGNFKIGTSMPCYKNMGFYIYNIDGYSYLSGNDDFIIQMEDKDGNYLKVGVATEIDFSLESIDGNNVYKLTDNVNDVSYLFTRVSTLDGKNHFLSDCVIMRESR